MMLASGKWNIVRRLFQQNMPTAVKLDADATESFWPLYDCCNRRKALGAAIHHGQFIGTALPVNQSCTHGKLSYSKVGLPIIASR
jgi:hypothetical protein